MRRIALTGGIGTGKTHVLNRFRDRGVPVIDADVIAREVVQPGSLGLRGIVKRFGPGVLTPEGTLDRARLGEIVFRDKDARRDLEAILHPLIRAAMEERFRELPPDTELAIADVPLLYETGRQRHFDRVIVAACPREVQIARVMARDGLSREDAERRVEAQLPIDSKTVLADHVIRTDGSFEETDRQVDKLLAQLRSDG